MGMEFRLVYEGPLYAPTADSNVDKKGHKQDIRRALHSQLERLWSGPQMKGRRQRSEAGTRTVRGLRFVSTLDSSMVCHLSLLVLRPGDPGKIITEGGDLDNRLKTFIDALRIPKANELPAPNPGDVPEPFYCVLDDDSQIVGFSVIGDILLRSAAPDHVLIVLHFEERVPTGTPVVTWRG
jgi:hypothetical protein